MHVVVTAGHVDHGKSTLVRALTGQEPDRLAEERRRGLTIELGYVWTELTGPDGSGVDEVAFVDVPGHQRFVTTALAGMGPVPVAMLVVAADDPWMPQAAEHLAALDALGVDRGVLVVTRSDLADPAPILARARIELARSSLARAPQVVVSVRTGAGLDLLRATLGEVLAGVPAPAPDQPVRLWIDRHFHVRGTGTVVTGTLPGGTIAAGDHLDVVGAGGAGRVRIRGVEALGISRGRMSGVARVALDLGGRAPAGIARGDALVTPDAFATTDLVDVELVSTGRRGADGSGSAGVPASPVLHIGSASQQVRARPLGDDHARLRLTHALPMIPGDRAVLRDPGSRAVWGVRVVDVAPPPLSRRGAASARGEALVLGVPDATEVPEPVTTPSVPAEPAQPVLADADLAVAARLDAWLAAHAEEAFAAPTSDDLAAMALDDGAAVRLGRADRLLRVAPGVLLRAGGAELAVRQLAELEQPFTTSAARQALGTSRRVALPLLAHLDKLGHTVRLADDTRRLRRG